MKITDIQETNVIPESFFCLKLKTQGVVLSRDGPGIVLGYIVYRIKALK